MNKYNFLFSKLINIAVPKTIDERAINLNFSKQDIFRQSENLELGERARKKKTVKKIFSLSENSFRV